MVSTIISTDITNFKRYHYEELYLFHEMSDEIEKCLEADTMYQIICIVEIVTILLVLKELEFETNIFSKKNTPRLTVVFFPLFTFSINKIRICKLTWGK